MQGAVAPLSDENTCQPLLLPGSDLDLKAFVIRRYSLMPQCRSEGLHHEESRAVAFGLEPRLQGTDLFAVKVLIWVRKSMFAAAATL